MKKRLTFQCGKCTRTFAFTPELTDKQELLFTCPFCGTELVLRLQPFRRKKITILRGEEQADEAAAWDYAFPDLLVAEVRHTERHD